jgi:hypothetical protein
MIGIEEVTGGKIWNAVSLICERRNDKTTYLVVKRYHRVPRRLHLHYKIAPLNNGNKMREKMMMRINCRFC